MKVKARIQGMVSAVIAPVLVTAFMATAAEAQSLDGEHGDTQAPTQVVQPSIVTAPALSEATGKKLKDVLPSVATPADVRTAPPVKKPKADPVSAPATEPVDVRSAPPVKKPKANLVSAPATEPVDVRSAPPVKKPKADPVSAPVTEPVDVRSAPPVKKPKAVPVAAPATEPVDVRSGPPVKRPRATVVEDHPEVPVDARSAHGQGGKRVKGPKLAAMRAQPVSHPVESLDPLACENRQESGSLGSLQAFNQRIREYDVEDEAQLYKELSHPHSPLPQGKASPVKGKTRFLKELARTMRDEVHRERRGIRNPRVAKLLCLQGVRMALQRAAGIKSHTWTKSAKNAGPYIVRELNYKKVPVGGQYNSRNVPFGAVLIYDDPRNSRAHGHIEIRGTDGYYSDFFSENPIDSKGRRRLIGIYLPPEQ